MTTTSGEGADTRLADPVWPASVSAEAAMRTVARRLAPGAELTARLYHSPFLGMMFLLDPDERRSRWRAPSGPVLAAVVVDLVSGRAFLTDPWSEADLITRGQAVDPVDPGCPVPTTGPAPRDPTPRVSEAEALGAGRALLPGLLARRRRLDALGAAELTGPPTRFGKPNWWVTGQADGRVVEVVVDALSGRHYARSA